jgi:hypothetical protein
VDLSDEGFREETPMSARIRETLEFILDALGMRITVDQRAEIENAYANSAPSAFRRLAGLLSSRSNSGKALPPIVLVVLLRRYSSPAEIAEYYDLARQGMIFFAEAFAELDAVKERERRFDREEADSLLLELDVLKTGDADLLIRRIRAEAGYLPEVNAEVLRDIESIIASPPPMGAGELARMAGGALRIAAAEAAPELETRHIVQYWRQAPPGNARD